MAHSQPVRLATPADAESVQAITTRAMAEPGFDFYSRPPLPIERIKRQIDNGLWWVCEPESGPVAAVLMADIRLPSATAQLRGRVHITWLAADLDLGQKAQRVAALSVLMFVVRQFVLVGLNLFTAEIPLSNLGMVNFIGDLFVEQGVVGDRRTSGVDPKTQAAQYQRVDFEAFPQTPAISGCLKRQPEPSADDWKRHV